MQASARTSWFLTGPTFLRKPNWKYSSKLYSGSKKLRSTCSGNNYSPYSTNLASDWLRTESSPVDEEERRKKGVTVAPGTPHASEGICLFVDLWEAQPRLGDPE